MQFINLRPLKLHNGLSNHIVSILLEKKGSNENYTVKPVFSGHSKIDKTKVLMTNGSLMKVESIAEYSALSILQYF